MWFRFVLDWFSPSTQTPAHLVLLSSEDVRAAYWNACDVYRRLRDLEWWLERRDQTDYLVITWEFRRAMERHNWGENPESYLQKHWTVWVKSPSVDKLLCAEYELPLLCVMEDKWKTLSKVKAMFGPLLKFEHSIVPPDEAQVTMVVAFLKRWVEDEKNWLDSNKVVLVLDDTNEADDAVTEDRKTK
jgi:hypothetical protein